MMFFRAKNDARENCQRGKVLTIFQIRIDQFQKMSPPKERKKSEKIRKIRHEMESTFPADL